MSFLDDFEDVFTGPEKTPTGEASTDETDSQTPVDYFDDEEEPVIW